MNKVSYLNELISEHISLFVLVYLPHQCNIKTDVEYKVNVKKFLDQERRIKLLASDLLVEVEIDSLSLGAVWSLSKIITTSIGGATVPIFPHIIPPELTTLALKFIEEKILKRISEAESRRELMSIFEEASLPDSLRKYFFKKRDELLKKESGN